MWVLKFSNVRSFKKATLSGKNKIKIVSLVGFLFQRRVLHVIAKNISICLRLEVFYFVS